MVRTRGGKSESADIEQEPGSISGDDVKEENTGSAACEGQASAWQGRGGPWCQPPRMFSPSMDVEVWLGRLGDYLSANAIPKALWALTLKSLVDDRIYGNLNALGPDCTYDQLTSYLR
ncbi:hypothetical protein M514_12207 [Trichuris suis]|uniref:Uncharacterized protein n=1 Tax=Trichuris suis TaxID=68888 RepID=A0A085N447_9BILA|nr:hypothetical protein M513_12207 [Trichuris suis]KFD64243.1 hypothetical protein M514_12207 [Trichuris suis]